MQACHGGVHVRCVAGCVWLQDDVFDDPKMGWSRWAHTFHIFTLNSGLFYIRLVWGPTALPQGQAPQGQAPQGAAASCTPAHR